MQRRSQREASNPACSVDHRQVAKACIVRLRQSSHLHAATSVSLPSHPGGCINRLSRKGGERIRIPLLPEALRRHVLAAHVASRLGVPCHDASAASHVSLLRSCQGLVPRTWSSGRGLTSSPASAGCCSRSRSKNAAPLASDRERSCERRGCYSRYFQRCAATTWREPSGNVGRAFSPCMEALNFSSWASEISTGVVSTNHWTCSLQGGVVNDP